MKTRLRRRDFLAALPAAMVMSCGRSTLWKGESGRVVSVPDGDVLVLDHGLRVRLVGIEAPASSWKERPGQPFADAAREKLENLALGRRCHLFYGGLTRDHYGRALAHVDVVDESGRSLWVNGHVVETGCARVRTWPDNCSRADDLLAREARARERSLGLWRLAAYAPLAPALLGAARGQFVLVESRDVAASIGPDEDGRCYATADGHLGIDIGQRLQRSRIEKDLGGGVRVRGRVRSDASLPSIALTHWMQVEAI